MDVSCRPFANSFRKDGMLEFFVLHNGIRNPVLRIATPCIPRANGDRPLALDSEVTSVEKQKSDSSGLPRRKMDLSPQGAAG